ncbi:hypothetical protein [Anaerobium acetethylicum]|uniref:Uncharacterized protein n=1 Tax=Anaerobium acetethylicum TaxID=1619234 RepID=A0A1D3TZA4_9FIRM|nr:hypothetical protein [Anaerobium acetethylicum]SCP99895.1 hypothetical protein SAMN05421730_10692 [Anaerobium acetethylicum]
MINTNDFEDMYNGLIVTVESEMELVEKGLTKRSKQQLKTIMYDLNKMNDTRDSKLFVPSYPRFIVDSWDFSDTLGIELLKLYELYKKIKNQ